MTLVPRLALPRMVRSTLLCDCGQYMLFCMLHTSIISPTKNRQSISTWCRKSSSKSALQPLNPRWMSEMKTVRNRSGDRDGDGALHSSMSRPPKASRRLTRWRFDVTEALLRKEDLFTKKALRRGTSRGTVEV